MILDDLTLPNNVIWLDEFHFNQVEQTRERSLLGGLIIQQGVKLYGRPITLDLWLDRQALDAIYVKEASVSHAMPMTLPDGREYTVIFDRSRGLAVEADPVAPYADASNTPDWKYRVTLRLVTVEPTGA